jgi:hypothetical protein
VAADEDSAAVGALNRALEIAEAAGAATQISTSLCELAVYSFDTGEVEEGFRLLARARSVPEASGDAWAVGWLASTESDALLTLGRFEEATRVGLSDVEALSQLGFGNSFDATVILANAIEGLLARGRTGEAAALIDPQIIGPVDREHWALHMSRADVDLLRGEVDAAAERLRQIEIPSSLDIAREAGRRVAEVALWAGRPQAALEEIERLLESLKGTHWVFFCGCRGHARVCGSGRTGPSPPRRNGGPSGVGRGR